MLGRSFGRNFALATALVAGLGAAVGFAQPAPTVQANAPRRAKEWLFSGNVTPGSWWRHTYLKHGPTAAQVKRTARKARNVRRNRAAHKG